MQISLNTSKWYDNLWAALIFFTRLPLWRIHQPPRQCYRAVVEYWPLVGWLTGGITAAVIFFGHHAMPYSVAILLAVAIRLLLTGALHEDGLCDFFDGFGGGKDRESTLRIMKDSHIGSYGVLGLIVYYLLGYALLCSLPLSLTPVVLFCGDAFAKFVCSFVIKLLPYARREEDSKAKVVYTPMRSLGILLTAAGGLIPLIPFVVFLPPFYAWVCVLPVLIFAGLVYLFKRRINGYTGDCCGALFLLCELGFWTGTVFVTYYSH